MVSSCRQTKYIEKPVVVTVHDTIQDTRIEHDSIYITDTVRESITVSGDTVYRDREHVVTKYKERQIHDTSYVVNENVVEVPTIIEKVIEKPLKWHQKALQFLGCLVVIAALGFVMAFFVNKKQK